MAAAVEAQIAAMNAATAALLAECGGPDAASPLTDDEEYDGADAVDEDIAAVRGLR